jgi:hypothetical protein
MVLMTERNTTTAITMTLEIHTISSTDISLLIIKSFVMNSAIRNSPFVNPQEFKKGLFLGLTALVDPSHRGKFRYKTLGKDIGQRSESKPSSLDGYQRNEECT